MIVILSERRHIHGVAAGECGALLEALVGEEPLGALGALGVLGVLERSS